MYYESNIIIDELNKQPKERELIHSEEDLKAFLTPDANGHQSVSHEEMLSAYSPYRLKLGEHMKLDNVIFLFGNGASIYAGSKDTRAFELTKYKDLDRYSNVKDIIEAVSNLRGVEEQLNALITIQSYYKIIGKPEEMTISSLISEVKKELIESFVNSVDYRNLTLHEVLLLKLRTFGCLDRTSVYTPNYDLAFEYSMDRLGIEYKDGFSGFVNRVFDPRTLQVRNKTALVKIHGSVNWITNDNMIKELQPTFRDGKVLINDTAPILIYPTSNKLYQTFTTPYSELMRHMLDEMETGKNVVIVLGYKYGDDHINEVLFKALQNPGNIFYFFLYNPNETGGFIDRIKKLAENMPNIIIFAGKILADFQNFVKYMLPATPEKTDQEKAIELLQKVLVTHEN